VVSSWLDPSEGLLNAHKAYLTNLGIPAEVLLAKMLDVRNLYGMRVLLALDKATVKEHFDWLSEVMRKA
jgi:hypothetical protein